MKKHNPTPLPEGKMAKSPAKWQFFYLFKIYRVLILMDKCEFKAIWLWHNGSTGELLLPLPDRY